MHFIIEKTGKLSVHRSIIRKDYKMIVRIEFAIEFMSEKLDNNLRALREELEKMHYGKNWKKIDAMELRLTEHVENNQKSMELMDVDQESASFIILTLSAWRQNKHNICVR